MGGENRCVYGGEGTVEIHSWTLAIEDWAR